MSEGSGQEDTPREQPKKRQRARRGRNEGAIFQRKDGTWSAEVSLGTDASGKRKRKTFYGKTKGAVQKKLTAEIARVTTGTNVEPSQLKLGPWIETWLANTVQPNLAANTYESYEITSRVHIQHREIARVKLKDLRAWHIEDLYTRLHKDGVSARTRENVHLVLSSSLKSARKLGHIAFNPCDDVEAPKRDRREMKVWTDAQARTFLEHAIKNRLGALYVLAIATGLRQGELFALKKTDIDMKRRTVSVQRSLIEIKGKITEGPPKTKSGERRVTLPQVAIDALERHEQAMIAEGNAESEYLFCDTEGGPLRKSNVRRRSLAPLIKRAGVPTIRFQDLRHTCATLLLGEGVHPKIVQERLGHSEIAVTLDTYSHVLPSMQVEAADRLDNLLSEDGRKRPRSEE